MLKRNYGWMNTCADVIEEIISEEIVDETDQFEDNQSKRRAKRMTTAAVMRGCVFPFSHPFLTQFMIADGYQHCRERTSRRTEFRRAHATAGDVAWIL